MAAILRKHSKDHRHRPPSKPVDGRCKKHPKHSQSPGVCSLCLTEKLSQLKTNATTSRRTNSTTTAGSAGSSTSSSLSSYYSSSSDSSACSSPMQQYRCHHYRNHNNFNIGREGRVASNSMSAFLFSGGNNVLKKSRSLAFGHRSTRRTDSEDDDQKRKTGFLSRLLIPQGNNKKRTTKAQQTFMHSRTVRERLH